MHSIIFWTVLILIVASSIEGGAAFVMKVLRESRVRSLLWDPDLVAVQAAWDANASKIDEELGWPPPKDATTGTRDATGAKLNKDFPSASGACMSAYGDSFIWGDEVPADQGWIEQLSRLLKCRVSNFGVSGYGTDQAYLRFRRTALDTAPVVLLGIFPDDIIRNVNQYRAFLGFSTEPFWLKGRFILNQAGNLQWIPRPHLDRAGFLDMHRNPAIYLPDEYFLPDTRDGPVSVRFPFTPAVVRLAMSPRVWDRTKGGTPWRDFYSFDHPSGAVPLTIAISGAFLREATRRDKRSFIMMVPGAGSLRELVRGDPDYKPFIAAMAENGIDVFDPAPVILQTMRGGDYCAIYTEKASCRGHFGVAGSSLLAQIVAAELRRRNLVK
jgi:hypothetical protein